MRIRIKILFFILILNLPAQLWALPPIYDTWISYDAGLNPNSVCLADLDGDADSDLVVANYSSNTVSVLLNNGDGSFAPKVDYPTGDSAWAVAVADLDGDLDLDLVVSNAGSDSV